MGWEEGERGRALRRAPPHPGGASPANPTLGLNRDACPDGVPCVTASSWDTSK